MAFWQLTKCIDWNQAAMAVKYIHWSKAGHSGSQWFTLIELTCAGNLQHTLIRPRYHVLEAPVSHCEKVSQRFMHNVDSIFNLLVLYGWGMTAGGDAWEVCLAINAVAGWAHADKKQKHWGTSWTRGVWSYLADWRILLTTWLEELLLCLWQRWETPPPMWYVHALSLPEAFGRSG